jgi:invasion protein IalB
VAPKPAVSQSAAQQTTAASAQLPNGASSINETYGDWTIDCRLNDGQKFCVLSQAQGNNQTGQRTFAIELRTPKDGKTDGTILMPFGLKLDAGATLKLDDKDLGQGVRFSTCVPQGCLLPVSFPAVATDAMKKGTKLAVTSLNLSSGEPATFSISLNGFAPAMARIGDLGK